MKFSELHEELLRLRSQREILMHLINHLDENFRPVAGKDPKKVMTLETDKTTRVTQDRFDDVVEDFTKQVQEIDQQITTILETDFGSKKKG